MPRVRARGGLSLIIPIAFVMALSSCTSKPPGAAGAARAVVPSASGLDGRSASDPSMARTSSSIAVAAPPSSNGPTSSSATDAPSSTTVNVYAATGPSGMSPAAANAKSYVYVPSNGAGTVTVIDQATMTVVDQFGVGRLPQHVVPSWDLRTLYATVSGSNELVPIDPSTGRPGKPIKVEAPYNLYFTPDGTTAIVMAERRNRIDFYDSTTWKLIRSISTGDCRGVNHADWSVDGSFFVATCEFSGHLIKVDTATGQVLETVT